jgi:hypothetical protein
MPDVFDIDLGVEHGLTEWPVHVWACGYCVNWRAAMRRHCPACDGEEQLRDEHCDCQRCTEMAEEHERTRLEAANG